VSEEKRALVKNAADEEQVTRGRKKEKYNRSEELADLRIVMQNPSGRRFLWRLLFTCHLYTTSFAYDPNRTAFNEGERNIGLQLVADMIEADPRAYAQMIQDFGK